MVDAGLELAAGLRFQDVLAAVETRAIAEAAGVTTGSFFHHFRSREHYALAVLDRWEELWRARVQRLAARADEAAQARGQGMRTAAEGEWAALAAAGVTESIQRLLWALREQPAVDGDAATGAERLARAYAELATTVRPAYDRGLRGMGREPLPPFTPEEIEIVTTAIAEGLQLRAGAQPELLRSDLYSDAITAFILGSTRPRLDRADDGDGPSLADLERRLGTAPEPTGAGRPDGDERWRAIADAASHLFVDRGPSEVRWSEVAVAAGVGVAVVQQEFHSVAAVAAAAWAQHAPALEAIAAAPMADDDPLRRIEALLQRWVVLARANRGATEALVGEIVAHSRPGVEPSRQDLRSLVPLPDLLEPLIAELRRRGRLRRRIEVGRLARSLLHVVTMQALCFPEDSAERVVDQTITIAFDGALVVPSDD